MTDEAAPAHYVSECYRIASRAKRHAISAGVANVLCVTAVIVVVIILPGSHPFLTALLAVANVVCAVATLAISVVLLLDAALHVDRRELVQLGARPIRELLLLALDVRLLGIAL